jgi:heme oxygenase
MLPLKEATAEKHRLAEKMPFNIKMFKGELSKAEYQLYLVQQLEIFKAIESRGLPHPNLSRASAIQEDIDELSKEGCNALQVLKSTEEYANYLKNISSEKLLSHIYLNYLAIMFGGQMMKKKVPSSGKMYDFENMKDAMMAIRALQKDEWADEVNRGFDYNIQMFADLEAEITKSLV